jgi:hypothetical protein
MGGMSAWSLTADRGESCDIAALDQLEPLVERIGREGQRVASEKPGHHAAAQSKLGTCFSARQDFYILAHYLYLPLAIIGSDGLSLSKQESFNSPRRAERASPDEIAMLLEQTGHMSSFIVESGKKGIKK